jgi:hypothetical protein
MRATFALFFVMGCNATQVGDLGNLVFDDNESLSSPGNGAFVVGDELSISAGVADGANASSERVVALSSNEGVIQFDPTPGGLSFRGTVVGEGLADLEVVDAVSLEVIDQISLQAATPFSIRVGAPNPFFSESIGESFDALHMFPGDSLALLSKPVSVSGQELKGQISGTVAIDAAVATVSAENINIGSSSFILTTNTLGVADLVFTTGTISSTAQVNVVSPDDATLTITIPEQDATPLTQGTIIADALLSDGNNIEGERYNIVELCVAGSAGAPCFLEMEPSFTPNAVLFAAKLSGRATIAVGLLNSDDVVIKTETLDLDVIAQ